MSTHIHVHVCICRRMYVYMFNVYINTCACISVIVHVDLHHTAYTYKAVLYNISYIYVASAVYHGPNPSICIRWLGLETWGTAKMRATGWCCDCMRVELHPSYIAVNSGKLPLNYHKWRSKWKAIQWTSDIFVTSPVCLRVVFCSIFRSGNCSHPLPQSFFNTNKFHKRML